MRVLSLVALSILLGLSPHYLVLDALAPFEDKRVLELIVLICTLLAICLERSVNRSTTHHHRLAFVAILVIAILALLSSLSAPSPRHAFLELGTFIGLGYLAVFISGCLLHYSDRFFHATLAVLMLGAGLYMIGFFTGYLASFIEGIPLIWPEPFYMVSNVRQFNQYQLWTLGLFTLPALATARIPTRYQRWLPVVLAFWWILLFASASRGVLVAWLVGIAATALIFRSKAWPFIGSQIKQCSFGFLGYWLLFVFLPQMNDGGGRMVIQTALRSQTEDRLYLWAHAWSMIKNHPWLGVGPMHFAWYPNDIGAHPHNSVIQLACEFGLPATVLALLLACHGLKGWVSRFNARSLNALPQQTGERAIALFFTLTTCCAYSLVDGVIVMPLSQVLMALICGLMIGIYRQACADGHLTTSANLLLRLLAGITLVTLVWAVLPELLPRIAGRDDLIPTGYQVLGPRFWQEGGIPHD